MTATPSNQFTFQMTLEQIIREAAQKSGGGPLDGEQLKSYINSFNIIQQKLLNRGLPLAWLLRGSLTVCSGCREYTLNSRIEDIHNAVIATSSDVDVRIERVSLAEYNEIPTKTRTGRPTTYAIERLHDALNLFVWPTPDQNYDLSLYVHTRPDDLFKYTDTVRLQPRMYPPLISGMAHEIAMKRPGTPLDLVQYLETQYEKDLREAYSEDRERSSYVISPQLNARGRF